MSVLLPHVSAARPVFLSCDLQEKFQNVIANFNEGVFVSNRMLQFANLHPQSCLYVVTEQYPKGLGHTVKSIDLSAAAKDLKVVTFEKTLFSMYTEDVKAAMLQHVGDAKTSDAKHAVLWGIEAHVCVLQTVESLTMDGWRVSVLCDGTFSQKEVDRKFAFKAMQRMPNVTLTTSESALLQMTRDASDPQFRATSALLRQRPPTREQASA
jgi:hypothetical protein